MIIRWTKYLIIQNFTRQNISSDKIFDTKLKCRQCCPIFAWLLYWNIGQSFRRTKVFVGQNFRHQADISTILSDEFLSDKVSKLQNRKLIQFMISKEGSTKFKNVKVIIHIIISASVKTSVESIVESLVSRYEHHFNSYRQLDKANAPNEMIISENGPALHDAYTSIERAMHKYWLEKSVNGKWHFIR